MHSKFVESSKNDNTTIYTRLTDIASKFETAGIKITNISTWLNIKISKDEINKVIDDSLKEQIKSLSRKNIDLDTVVTERSSGEEYILKSKEPLSIPKEAEMLLKVKVEQSVDSYLILSATYRDEKQKIYISPMSKKYCIMFDFDKEEEQSALAKNAIENLSGLGYIRIEDPVWLN